MKNINNEYLYKKIEYKKGNENESFFANLLTQLKNSYFDVISIMQKEYTTNISDELDTLATKIYDEIRIIYNFLESNHASMSWPLNNSIDIMYCYISYSNLYEEMISPKKQQYIPSIFQLHLKYYDNYTDFLRKKSRQAPSSKKLTDERSQCEKILMLYLNDTEDAINNLEEIKIGYKKERCFMLMLMKDVFNYIADDLSDRFEIFIRLMPLLKSKTLDKHLSRLELLLSNVIKISKDIYDKHDLYAADDLRFLIEESGVYKTLIKINVELKSGNKNPRTVN